MNASEFYIDIKQRISAAIERVAPFRAKATNVNSSGIQIQTLGADTPLGERFPRLKGPVIAPGDDVVVIPYEGSNLILGTIGDAVESVPDGSITSAKIADGTIQKIDLSSSLQNEINVKNDQIIVYNNNGSGDVLVIASGGVTSLYGSSSSGISLVPSPWNPNQIQINARWGTTAGTIAEGNHSHTITSAFPMTHRTGFASMNLRMGPSTTFTSIATLPINTQMHRTGWTQVAGGYTWHFVLCNGWGWGWFAGTVGTDLIAL